MMDNYIVKLLVSQNLENRCADSPQKSRQRFKLSEIFSGEAYNNSNFNEYPSCGEVFTDLPVINLKYSLAADKLEAVSVFVNDRAVMYWQNGIGIGDIRVEPSGSLQKDTGIKMVELLADGKKVVLDSRGKIVTINGVPLKEGYNSLRVDFRMNDGTATDRSFSAFYYP